MKFKIKKGTRIFNRLDAIYARMKNCKNAAKALAEKHGWKEWYKKPGAAAGGIGGVKLDQKPEGWKLAAPRQSKRFFYPKQVKANKDILEELNALPVVMISEISDALGYGLQVGPQLQISRCPGVIWRDEYILLDVHDWCEWRPEEGKEILVSEYNELVKQS